MRAYPEVNTLESYIFRQLLGPFGFFTLVFTGVIWLTQSLRVVDTVVNNGQGARVFLEFTGLLLPLVMSIVLQLAALAATLYAVHRLLSESELVAAFASGVSKLRAVRPIAIFGALVTAALAFNTIYLMPTAAQTMKDRVAEVRGDVAAGLIRDGRFLHPAKGLTVYIREIASDGRMLGIMVQDAREGNSSVTYTAKQGFLTTASGTPTLAMFDGVAQRFEEGRRLSLLRFETFTYDLAEFVNQENNRNRKPSERYFWELVNPDPELVVSERRRGKWIAEGHEQLSSPLYALALPLVAAAALFSARFSRRGFGGRIAVGLLLGAGLRVLGIVAKSVTTSAPFLWPVMYLVPIGGIAVALYVLSRNRLPSPLLRRPATSPAR
ncbi:MAG: LPS export ABC transporter permease LptF [Pseudomonadota bacterium]